MAENHDYTYEIILATYPHIKRSQYVKNVKENFIKKFKNSGEEELKLNYPNCMYNPIAFHLFGSFDIAFISLIDSYKFTQKLFIPSNGKKEIDNREAEISLFPSTFQVLTGINANPNIIKKEVAFENLSAYNYIGISNLKLNNGFSIGNTFDLIKQVVNIINDKIEGRNNLNFSIIKSFNWADLAIIIIGDDLKTIANFITELRCITIGDLKNDDFLKNSINSLTETNIENLKNIHLFSDTHTHFGINFDYINGDETIDCVIPVSIEMQVKPGHFEKIKKEFSLNLADSYFVGGKTDFLLKNNLTINNNVTIFKLLENESKYYDHYRRIKTKVLFDDFFINKKEFQASPQIIKEFIFSDTDIKELSSKLKNLKVSRQIREKLLKIFYNYNNGIGDSILFTYFLDLTDFVDGLADVINKRTEMLEKLFKDQYIREEEKPFSVNNIEDIFRKYIEAFEEGHQVRMLNTYSFEDANDFDIDLNCSIESLLSSYSSLTFLLKESILPELKTPIVKFNLKNTVANYVSINFGLNELVHPEFIFFTILKEIGNLYVENKAGSHAEIIEQLNKEFKKIFELEFVSSKRNAAILTEMFEQGLISFDNFIIDIFRIEILFKRDFEQFSYWHWSYNLQFASLYTIYGAFDEDHLKKELFRLFLVAFYLNNIQTETDITKKNNYFDQISCPVTELNSNWQKWFKTFYDIFQFNAGNEKKELFVKKTFSFLTFYYFDVFLRKLNMYSPNDKEIGENQNLKNEFIKGENLKIIFSRCESIWENYLIKALKSIDSNPISTNLIIEAISLIQDYLKAIENKNKKLQLLNRKIFDGEPKNNKKNKDTNNSTLYLIDPIGGVFFNEYEKSKEYFILRDDVLKKLWDLSQKSKKEYVKIYLKKKKFNHVGAKEKGNSIESLILPFEKII